ncbi:antibiotic biosynthesis monooxygenase family protein [Streptomyces sp. NPDC007808]|uniref:antibiotic biosynthesis monooxygenase family protein n=1 Tax=Streptomyces sp. NPDC007808 TaxID=3364779 RepID=UPI0036B873DC
MSDHRMSPVVPVPAHEPPYYAVVFTSLRTEGDDGYGATAQRMGELVKEIPGFLGEDSARSPGGLSITVAYFRDLAGIEQWRDHAEHRAAKAQGRAHWYECYSLHIAKVEHSNGFERGSTPTSGPCEVVSPDGVQR